jgi:hypothetical protein
MEKDFVVMAGGFHHNDRLYCKLLFRFFKEFKSPFEVGIGIMIDPDAGIDLKGAVPGGDASTLQVRKILYTIFEVQASQILAKC